MAIKPLKPIDEGGGKGWNWSNDIFVFQFWNQLEEIVLSGTVFELVLSSVAWVAIQYLVSPSRKTDTCLALLIKCQFSHWIVAIILIICTILWPLFRFALSNTCDGAFWIHQIVQNRWMTQPVKISSLRSWGIACTRFFLLQKSVLYTVLLGCSKQSKILRKICLNSIYLVWLVLKFLPQIMMVTQANLVMVGIISLPSENHISEKIDEEENCTNDGI